MQYLPNQPSQSHPNDQTIPGQFYPIAPPPPPPPEAHHKRFWRWYRAQRKRTQWGIGCGIIAAAFFLCICSAAFAATPGVTTQVPGCQAMGKGEPAKTARKEDSNGRPCFLMVER